jgi:hypothetical protein
MLKGMEESVTEGNLRIHNFCNPWKCLGGRRISIDFFRVASAYSLFDAVRYHVGYH